MRRIAPFLLPLLFLTACAPSGNAQTSLEQYLKHGMEPLPLGSCPFPTVQGVPELAGIQAHGLEALGWWRPGYVNKVNWVAAESIRMNLTLTAFEASQRQQYVLNMPAEPSVVQFPGPGCWELELEAGGQSAQLYIPVRPDRPSYLGALPDGPRDPATLLTASKDLEALLKLVASGKEGPMPDREQPSWWLSLVWEHTGSEALRYYPSGAGKGALLVVPKSLVSGNCADGAKEIVREVPSALSKTIEHDLTSMVLVPGDKANPAKTGSCYTFTNKANLS